MSARTHPRRCRKLSGFTLVAVGRASHRLGLADSAMCARPAVASRETGITVTGRLATLKAVRAGRARDAGSTPNACFELASGTLSAGSS